MMNNDSKHTKLNHHQNSPEQINQRLVWQQSPSEAPRSEAESAKEVQKDQINLLNDVNFDNQHFQTEKSVKIDTPQDSFNAVKNIVDQLPVLKGSPEAQNILSKDLNQGLEQSLNRYYSQILSTFNIDLSEWNQTFQGSAAIAKLTMILNKHQDKTGGLGRIAIIHDNSSDLLKFKFYNKEGVEHQFKHNDIAVQYTPRNLKDSRVTGLRTKEQIESTKSPETSIKIDGLDYSVLKNIDSDLSYLGVAEDILSGKSTILPEAAANEIKNTKISAAEYAQLLFKAHEAVGKDKKLPIIRPNLNFQRVQEARINLEKESAQTQKAKKLDQSQKESLSKLTETQKRVVQIVQERLSQSQIAKFTTEVKKYEAAVKKNPKKSQELFQDLLETLDNYIPNTGLSYSISKELEKVMDQGENSQEWLNVWRNSGKEITNLINQNPQIFGKLSSNQIRSTIYELVRDGSDSKFQSEDILKHFKTKLPDNKESADYDQLIALAISPDSTDPTLRSKQNEYRRFIQVIESLGLMISTLNITKSSPVEKNVIKKSNDYSKLESFEAKDGHLYFELNKLNQLSRSTPGISAQEFLNQRTKEKEAYIQNGLTKDLRNTLNAAAILGNAKIVDSELNLANIKANKSALVNVRYQGKDFTLLFENPGIRKSTLKIANGFNVKSPNTEIYSAKGFSSFDGEDAAKALNSYASKTANSINYLTTTDKNKEKVTMTSNVTAEYNNSIKHPDLFLLDNQVTELLFRLYSFEQLIQQGAIKKVSNAENSFIITNLPKNFSSKISENPAEIRNVILAIKYPNAPQANLEKASEIGNKNQVIRNKLNQIFAANLVTTDQKGRRTTMENIDTQKVKPTDSDFFNETSGSVAIEDLRNQTLIRDINDNQFYDETKLNQTLTKIYRLGYEKLQSKLNLSYKKPRRINILEDNFDDLDKEILRAGYIENSKEQENSQKEVLAENKKEIIANILKVLPEEIKDENGNVIKKEKFKAALNTLPISVLLAYAYSPETGHDGGIYAPITINVVGNTNLILLPGISTQGLNLAVGVSTSADIGKNTTIYGGLSLGLLGASANAGVEVKVNSAKAVTDKFVGISGGVGFNPLEGELVGVNLEAYYKWEKDLQKDYQQKLFEEYKNKNVDQLINELKDIYTNGSSENQVNSFAQKLKTDANFAKQFGLQPNDSPSQVLNKFETYIAQITEEFSLNYDPGTILGGKVGVGAIEGALMSSGLTPASFPLLLTGAGLWGAKVLGSLKFNIGSKLVMDRATRTSENELSLILNQSKNKQLNEIFNSFSRTPAAQKVLKSGETFLGTSGEKVTSTSEFSEMKFENLSANTLERFNQSLRAKNIDIRLKLTTDNKIEIELLDSAIQRNERILISPNLVAREGNKFFLKSPKALEFLYIDQQTRQYPFPVSEDGTSIERVVTISDNRFHESDHFPSEVTIIRSGKNKDLTIEGNLSTQSESIGKLRNLTNKEDYSRMSNALNEGNESLDQSIDPNLETFAADIFKFKDQEGNTFKSITLEEARKNLDLAKYTSEKLYKFYDEYAKFNGIRPFSAAEKQKLTLELSTLRYTKLAKNEMLFRKRVKDWGNETLTPYLAARQAELQQDGREFQYTPAQLADHITQSIQGLFEPWKSNLKNYHQLESGESIATAIGGDSAKMGVLHQILNGYDSQSAGHLNEYGYLVGKDYSNSLETKQPPIDYEAALLLMGQLSPLPDRIEVENFMDSNLARKLASNPGLGFIIGQENYLNVVNYYETGNGNTQSLKAFMDLVERIRNAQINGEKLISIQGISNTNFNIVLDTKITTGIFDKCANFTATIKEGISIIPPLSLEEINLAASSSEARTTVQTQVYKEFYGLMGGVTASVSFESEASPADQEEKNDAGQGPEVDGNLDPEGAGRTPGASQIDTNTQQPGETRPDGTPEPAGD